MRPVSAPFPMNRPRRLRRTPWMRDLVRETALSPSDLIWPLFVCDGEDVEQPIEAMPGVSRWSVDRVVEQAQIASAEGIPLVALFPYTDPGLKTPGGDEAWNPDNLVNRATRACWRAFRRSSAPVAMAF